MESEQIKEKVKDVKTLNRAQRRSLERRPHSSIFHKKFETKTKLLLAKVEYVSKNSGQTGLKEFKSELISKAADSTVVASQLIGMRDANLFFFRKFIE